MNIIVCVKELIEPGVSDSSRGISSGKYRSHMNSYDLYGIEEGVLLREKIPGTRVDAITAGHKSSSGVLRKALEMGADNGFQILIDESSSTESFYVAPSIADFISRGDYDLIITGVLSEDTLQGEMGGLLAGKLGIPFAHSVVKIEYSADDHTIHAESEIDGGTRIVYRLPLPALVSVQSGINTPRYPKLSNKLRAKKQELIVIRPTEGEISSSGKVRVACYRREGSGGGTVLRGTKEEKADKLLHILHEKRLLR
jgi:electron transfer flavoprotein beta subunit